MTVEARSGSEQHGKPIPGFFEYEFTPTTVKKLPGIITTSPSGEHGRTYLLDRNINLGQSPDPQTARRELADDIARLKVIYDKDAIIGPGIDLESSDADTGRITVHTDPGIIGLYIAYNQIFAHVPNKMETDIDLAAVRELSDRILPTIPNIR